MLTWLRMDQKEVLHSIRTAVAAVGSLLIARLCRLPEAYWAAVTTIRRLGPAEDAVAVFTFRPSILACSAKPNVSGG